MLSLAGHDQAMHLTVSYKWDVFIVSPCNSQRKQNKVNSAHCSEAATKGILWKKMFLEISKNSQENKERDSGTGVFLWILRSFLEHLFYRTPLDDCFWLFLRDSVTKTWNEIHQNFMVGFLSSGSWYR